MNFSYVLKDYKIKNISELLDKKVKKIEYTPLPQAGFGSVMMKLDVLYEHEDSPGTVETLRAVAKVLPPDEKARELFQIDKTYNNEVKFYSEILPALDGLRREYGRQPLRLAAEFFGGRVSLKEGEKVDDDAVLVLEDLTISGFANLSSGTFFDLEATELILQDIALLHATGIALKLKKPEAFQKVLVSQYQQYIFPEDKGPGILIPTITSILLENEECRRLLNGRDKIWDVLDFPEPSEPYSTVTHNDLWMNNTMQRTMNGRTVENRLIDFQLLSYRSSAVDVFFFVWTSVRVEIIRNKLDYLLQFYHRKLLDTLRELECDLGTFTYEKFLGDMRAVGNFEFGHAAAFATAIRTIFKSDAAPLGNVDQGTKEFLWFMFLECAKRGWIQY